MHSAATPSYTADVVFVGPAHGTLAGSGSFPMISPYGSQNGLYSSNKK